MLLSTVNAQQCDISVFYGVSCPAVSVMSECNACTGFLFVADLSARRDIPWQLRSPIKEAVLVMDTYFVTKLRVIGVASYSRECS